MLSTPTPTISDIFVYAAKRRKFLIFYILIEKHHNIFW